jgi:hypothetical protein
MAGHVRSRTREPVGVRISPSNPQFSCNLIGFDASKYRAKRSCDSWGLIRVSFFIVAAEVSQHDRAKRSCDSWGLIRVSLLIVAAEVSQHVKVRWIKECL